MSDDGGLRPGFLRSTSSVLVLAGPLFGLWVGCRPSEPTRVAPDVRPAIQPPVIAPVATPSADEALSYVLPVDYGIRVDKAGHGGFRAKRSHGEHNGIDLLAPIGTDVLALCSGSSRSGNTGDFGNWVQLVCPLPPALGGAQNGQLSLFYAHLSEASVGSKWEPAEVGQRLGAVGKTGNASGPSVEPHLHFELIVADDEQAAKSETHSGLVQTSNWAVARFLSRLSRGCLVPSGFGPSTGELQRGRRVDPFVVQRCLVKNKPPLRPAPPPVRVAGEKWSQHYSARGFDVDAGEAPAFAESQPIALDANFFVGTWSGESRGTQVFAELRVTRSRQFSLAVATGPDSRCSAEGGVTLERDTLRFDPSTDTCTAAETRFEMERVIDVAPDTFAIADAEQPNAVVRRGDGELEGPVWVFRRISGRTNGGP